MSLVLQNKYMRITKKVLPSSLWQLFICWVIITFIRGCLSMGLNICALFKPPAEHKLWTFTFSLEDSLLDDTALSVETNLKVFSLALKHSITSSLNLSDLVTMSGVKLLVFWRLALQLYLESYDNTELLFSYYCLKLLQNWKCSSMW